MHAPVYRYHLQNTNDYRDWLKIDSLYVSTVSPQERTSAMNALAQTRSFWLIDTYLEELLEVNSKISAEDFYAVLSNIGRNPSGRYIVWTFVRYKLIQIEIE